MKRVHLLGTTQLLKRWSQIGHHSPCCLFHTDFFFPRWFWPSTRFWSQQSPKRSLAKIRRRCKDCKRIPVLTLGATHTGALPELTIQHCSVFQKTTTTVIRQRVCLALWGVTIHSLGTTGALFISAERCLKALRLLHVNSRSAAFLYTCLLVSRLCTLTKLKT